jgi:hypothetical protein
MRWPFIPTVVLFGAISTYARFQFSVDAPDAM